MSMSIRTCIYVYCMSIVGTQQSFQNVQSVGKPFDTIGHDMAVHAMTTWYSIV